MLKRTVRKIRSEHGASLSMALMLFLVCTVVASVAIAAGSATAGRLSQLREMDKSYYNVTSAAKLFVDELPVTVTVKRSCNATKTSDEWVADDNTWTLDIDDIPMLDKDGNMTSLSSNSATLFEILTCDLLFGNGDDDLSAARNITVGQVKASMDIPSTRPEPNEVEFSSREYKRFTVNADGTINKLFNTVYVTVIRNVDDTFSIVFTEDQRLFNDDQTLANIDSTLPVYTVVASAEINTVSPNPDSSETERTLEWATRVKWRYVYTVAGVA